MLACQITKDHKFVTCLLTLSCPAVMKREKSHRDVREFNVSGLKKYLSGSFSFLNEFADDAVTT